MTPKRGKLVNVGWLLLVKITIGEIYPLLRVHILSYVTPYNTIYYSSDHIKIYAKQISKKIPIIHPFVRHVVQYCPEDANFKLKYVIFQRSPWKLLPFII